MSHPTRRTLLAGLGGCAVLAGAGGRPAAAGETVSFGYQRSSSLLSVLKVEHRLDARLAAHGCAAGWSLFGNVLDPMNAGSTDFHADVADAVPIFTQAAGAPLTYYAAEAPSPRAEALIVHADSDVRQVVDLRGRRVAIGKGSGCHYLVLALLRQAGLRFSDVTPVYLAPPEAAQAFEQRSVDAWAIWDPFLAITQHRLPVRVVGDGGGGVTGYSRYYMVNTAFVKRHPDIVQTVFDALVETGQRLRQDPGAAAALLGPLWGDLPAEVVLQVNARRSYDVQPVQPADLSGQQRIADAFLEAGLIPQRLVVADVPVWHPQRAG